MNLTDEQRLYAETAFAQSLNVIHHAYVDIAGDLVAGSLLGQILYWLAPSKNGEPRAQIQKDGRYWIAKARADWHKEIRISPKQYDRAIGILKAKGFVDVRTMKFDGNPTTHISVIPEAINTAVEQWKIEQVKTLLTDREEQAKKALDEALAGSLPFGNNDVYQTGTTAFTESVVPYSPKVNNGVNLSGISSYTEITTENVTENTINADAEFERVWQHYPKKQGKAKALKAFKKALAGEGLKKSDGEPYTPDEIFVKVVLYNQFISQQLESGEIDFKFVPTGGNWFENEQWADESQDISATFENFEDGMNYSLQTNKMRLLASKGNEYREQIEQIVITLPY